MTENSTEDSQTGKQVPIGPGTRVTLTFALRLASGEEIDTISQPATFTVGDGNLLPGFEKAMFGMKAGDSGDLDIQPEDAFGEPNPESIHWMKRSSFSPELELSEGLVVSFQDEQKRESPGVVTRIEEDRVEVDFNHPLAGQALVFSVHIRDVEQVSNEILRM